jgi:hypothetical protein
MYADKLQAPRQSNLNSRFGHRDWDTRAQVSLEVMESDGTLPTIAETARTKLIKSVFDFLSFFMFIFTNQIRSDVNR